MLYYMSQDVIDSVEKISILFKLVQHYFNKSSIIFNITLAVELSNTLNYIKNNSQLNNTINSEYAEHLNKLLMIVLDYYPKILKELNKCDVGYHNTYLISDKINSNKNINVIQFSNSYNEIDYLLKYINSNINKNIAIICTNKTILNLLTYRLEFESIPYSNNAKYNKNYYRISQAFKNKVAYYFPNINSKDDLIQITKLLSFMDTKIQSSSNINICDFNSLQVINNSDVVFCLSMNNNDWKLQNNTFFNIMSHKYNINNIFNYIVNNSKELYCLYSSIVNRKPVIKSSVLNKLTPNNKCNVVIENYTMPINDKQYIINNSLVIPNINDNLIVLSGRDVSNLLYDTKSFYINNILGLKKDIKNNKDNIYMLFKNIFYTYFNKNSNNNYLEILNIAEKLDPLYYKKFKQIIAWLRNNFYTNPDLEYVFSNDLLQTIIDNNIVIKTHCDRIEIKNNRINIKKYAINKIANKNSILSGKESNLLTQALILKINKIINEFSEITLEIISPNWNINANTPITINKITLPLDNIDKYLDNIINALKNYNTLEFNTNIENDSYLP